MKVYTDIQDGPSSSSDQLRRAIKHRLQAAGAAQEMNSVLLKTNSTDPDTIIQMLQEMGVISKLAKQIGPSRTLYAHGSDMEPSSNSPKLG